MEIQNNQGICTPKGFYANGIHCGIRKNKTKKDLSLVYSDTMCIAASCYTLNKVQGAPIKVTKEHLKDHQAQAIIINSGNANTCNSNGLEIANQMCELTANALQIKKEDIIVASTGVIGEKLSINPIKNHIVELAEGLSKDKALAACEGIMTTDTYPKQFNTSFEIDGHTCHIGAMAKGSGMIHPNMATLLSFITSDVDITADMLDELIHEVCNDTLNMISIDGDTSTNDMLSILCNGKALNPQIREKNENYAIFKNALLKICEQISRTIAKDGEGATKLLICNVTHAKDTPSAKAIAKSVIHSSLVKSAMFGCDANWGRVLCAIGYSDATYNAEVIDVAFESAKGWIDVCKQSQGLLVDEDKALEILKEDEITIHVNMHDGDKQATSWGCDLTYEYVKINGEYRT
ncbi:glutamate N-acetyltransferase/amino-acid N-acetyltransferase [Breznakia sp. PF5-3]|uniref:bifunctional glutamate N-acetyltransferase/amino-acid acetyltransferase ArgJ n=1 Tax=unclassified Breznakia TaxID=2623764 RepID=UPI0024073179|nr:MULTISPECIES: bifunctional glutamate N-acetyltransferase/amino-acid acetyltransferase ArgJ [unclassified Breznakia]MDF9825569.1 glutamate N-acetyltransferase/amino-acid N-acetyltransferase [Breznakia sp. PM6-1]MDF9835876.1 glutamate N-acetyltransferase/amino-acid N-acetyltransferase [Breznakia sp. PF5-3]MDF9837621.1 glutamate N-acetyltransferase/amino-acid N-acetyltransferase [Breznakia sp. PFB2-8]MDF9859998.1 glutamate N-acetyltransferase/amino-acid N-acetyltransferase [Breznakia sp. PH5-24